MQSVIINDRAFPFDRLRVLELHADYGCANTGRCCRSPWNISVTDAEKARVEGVLAAAGDSAPQIAARFQGPPPGGDSRFARLRQDEHHACTFAGLDPNGASFCGLQRAHGHAPLPSICQAYPRIAVATPAGCYLTLSSTCPTAAKLLLNPGGLKETAPRGVMHWRPALRGEVFDDRALPPELAPGIRPSWAAWDYFWRWSVEWLARPALEPAPALYFLGIVIGQLEANAALVRELPGMIDVLDQFMAIDPAGLRAQCAALAPMTELGMVWLETSFNLMAEAGAISGELEALRQIASQAPGRDPGLRAQLAARYDATLRPRLPEFATLERNFIAARLWPNPLTYTAPSLRGAYLMVALSLVQLRFVTLLKQMRAEAPLDPSHWLDAAGAVDNLLQHSPLVQKQFHKLLGPRLGTEMQNLALIAMF